MAEIKEGRWIAEVEGEFVVFLAMSDMLIELFGKPELGLLSARMHLGLRNTMVVQYWRSDDQLHAYATHRARAHRPAWKAFNQRVAKNGDVGIWHKRYTIRPGQSRNIYGNMPACRPGLAGMLRPAGGKH